MPTEATQPNKRKWIIAMEQPERLDDPQKHDLLKKYLRPITVAPELDKGANITGGEIIARVEDKDFSPKFFGLYAYYFIGYPTKYRVHLLSHPTRQNCEPNYGIFSFHGEMNPDEFEEIYPGRLDGMKPSNMLKLLRAIGIGLIIATVGLMFWGRAIFAIFGSRHY